MVVFDFIYDDYFDGVGIDDLIDLGIWVGKMRIIERIGGFNRLCILEEVSYLEFKILRKVFDGVWLFRFKLVL